jgi:hypothetical protein
MKYRYYLWLVALFYGKKPFPCFYANHRKRPKQVKQDHEMSGVIPTDRPKPSRADCSCAMQRHANPPDYDLTITFFQPANAAFAPGANQSL